MISTWRGSSLSTPIGSVFRRGLPVVLSLLGLAGCASWLPEPFTQPAYQVKLYGSAWSITSIDGVRTSSEHLPSVTFGDEVIVDTGCRVLTSEFDMDTDGSELRFDVREPSPGAGSLCAPDVAPQDRAVIEALNGAATWAVADHDHVAFQGQHFVALQRR
jgi:heat shock protein HslJ